jgi:hypothetical protein
MLPAFLSIARLTGAKLANNKEFIDEANASGLVQRAI